MILSKRNFYILKQSDSITWNFLFKEDSGLLYRILKNNEWSEYNIVSNESNDNFSVVLSPDDKIYVIYQNLNNNIMLSIYDGASWESKKIMQNKQNAVLDIYFNAVLNENKLHIFYSISNKKTKTMTFFHQIMNEEFNLSTPKAIDTTKLSNNIPFKIHVSKDNKIFIMYEKYSNKYEIGYKQYHGKKWSNFYKIDSNSYSYTDYSLLSTKDTLHLLYVTNNRKDNKSIVYSKGKNSDFTKIELFESGNIDSCSLFMLKDNLWVNWIDNNTVYSSFSINNGKKFSIPPYHEFINSSNIIKASYLSNYSYDKEYLLIDGLYINEDNLSYLILPNIYPHIDNNEKNTLNTNFNRHFAYIKDYMTKAYEKILAYEKLLKEKDRLITEINYEVKEQRNQSLLYEKKYNSINKKYIQYEKEKGLLSENINSLQEMLISKDKKINQLENLNLEKEKHITSLNNKITEIEHITSLKEEELISLKDNFNLQNDKISNFEEESKILKNQISDLESKLNSANVSIFKKIFGNNQ